jgi:flagellar motor switch protein FliG
MNKIVEGNMENLNKLMDMSDRQIQEWLRKIGTETDINTLPIALLDANDEIKECIFRNMSMHAKTAVQKSIHEQSQNNIEKSEIQKNINIITNLI